MHEFIFKDRHLKQTLKITGNHLLPLLVFAGNVWFKAEKID